MNELITVSKDKIEHVKEYYGLKTTKQLAYETKLSESTVRRIVKIHIKPTKEIANEKKWYWIKIYKNGVVIDSRLVAKGNRRKELAKTIRSVEPIAKLSENYYDVGIVEA